MAVLGMGGIGKTSLAARVAQDVAPSFARVDWRSMRDAPPVSEWLARRHRISVRPSAAATRSGFRPHGCLAAAAAGRRCLLVLDNSETLFEPGQPEGRYRAGMGGYGRLLQSVGDASHESCLVVTSREAPLELAMLSGAVRSLELTGLGIDDAQTLLAPKHLSGTAANWAQLTATVGGNGLALKVVGERIREVFAGDIAVFLEEGWAGGTFGSIRRLLAEQVDRSSELEQLVLRVLAIEREPLSLTALLAARAQALDARRCCRHSVDVHCWSGPRCPVRQHSASSRWCSSSHRSARRRRRRGNRTFDWPCCAGSQSFRRRLRTTFGKLRSG